MPRCQHHRELGSAVVLAVLAPGAVAVTVAAAAFVRLSPFPAALSSTLMPRGQQGQQGSAVAGLLFPSAERCRLREVLAAAAVEDQD